MRKFISRAFAAALIVGLLAALPVLTSEDETEAASRPNAWVIEPTRNGWAKSPIVITGRARSTVGVSHLMIAIMDRATGSWWQADAAKWTDAYAWARHEPQRRFRTNTLWSLPFDPVDGSGRYRVIVTAFDVEGAQDPTPARVNFVVPNPSWQLVFEDDFAEPVVDDHKWQVLDNSDYGTGDGGLQVDRDQCYMASNVELRWGQLHLNAERESPADACGGRLGWTSGMVNSNDSRLQSAGWTRGNKAWTYGRIAVRARFESDQGMWPAIWLRPRDNAYGPWPKSGEIDIMEHAGPNPVGIKPECRGSVTSSAHWRGFTGDHLNAPGCVPLTELHTGNVEAWHVYELIWGPDEMIWKVDGKVTRRSTPDVDGWWAPGGDSPAAPFDKPFFMTINLQVAGWANHPAPDLQSGSMAIDWVRVWQQG